MDSIHVHTLCSMSVIHMKTHTDWHKTPYMACTYKDIIMHFHNSSKVNALSLLKSCCKVNSQRSTIFTCRINKSFDSAKDNINNLHFMRKCKSYLQLH